MTKENNELIEQADEEYEALTGDAEIKRLAEVRLMSKLEEGDALATAKDKGRAEGEAKGKKEGQREKQIEIAKKLLQEDVEIEIIIKTTGLTKDELEKITNDNRGYNI